MSETSLAMLEKLPAAGADLIELGMPFSDPMADGPAMQASSLRALKAGATLTESPGTGAKFRKTDSKTPIVLMGYYNPIHAYGTARFAKDAADGGRRRLDHGRSAARGRRSAAPAGRRRRASTSCASPRRPPTTARLKAVLDGASGFLYYVSIAGVTGTKNFDAKLMCAPPWRDIKRQANCPARWALESGRQSRPPPSPRIADGAVVGSAIVERDRGNVRRAKGPNCVARCAGILRISGRNRCMQRGR